MTPATLTENPVRAWLYPTVVLLYLALLAAGIGGLWWQAPAGTGIAPRLIMTAVFYLPLLVLGIGIWLRDARLLTWFCFLLLVYFTGFVTQATDPGRLTLSLLRIALVTLLFGVTLVYIRALHHQRQPPP